MSRRTHRPAVVVRSRQLHLPAGFLADGTRAATLKEVISPKVATIDGPQLTDDQRAALTAQRIAAQPRFRVATLSRGIVEKEQAIQEVLERTALGTALIDIEHRAIEMLRVEAERRRRARARKAATSKRRAGRRTSARRR